MVRGVIPNNYIPDAGSAAGASSGRKLSLPVEPGALIYSYLKNVSGIPAPEGSSGITISKLNMLDVLIEQMNKIKKPAVAQAGPNALGKSGKLDAMVEAYKTQFRQARAANEAMPYNPPPQAPAGALLRISA
jgi:hypothetical protein